MFIRREGGAFRGAQPLEQSRSILEVRECAVVGEKVGIRFYTQPHANQQMAAILRPHWVGQEICEINDGPEILCLLARNQRFPRPESILSTLHGRTHHQGIFVGCPKYDGIAPDLFRAANT